MQIIGESINGSIPTVAKAIQYKDAPFLTKLAREQVKAGAEKLDVNANVIGTDEVEMLPWLVGVVQAETDVPLVLDSVSTQAIEATLCIRQGAATINSLSEKQNNWRELLALATGHQCGIIIQCIGGAGIPATAAERFVLAERMVELAVKAGIGPQDIYVDPVILSAGADWQAGKVTLETLRLIREGLPEVHTICPVSNISYGLPYRRLLNTAFLAMLIAAGADTLMIDVRNRRATSTVIAANALAGNDHHCLAYLKAFRTGRLQD